MPEENRIFQTDIIARILDRLDASASGRDIWAVRAENNGDSPVEDSR